MDKAELSELEHPRRGERCEVSFERTKAGWFGRCLTHGTEADARAPRQRDAERDFACDKGRHWAFIIANPFDQTVLPRMVDLSGFKAEARAYVQNTQVLGGRDPRDVEIVAWRFADGETEVVDLGYRRVAGSAEKFWFVASSAADGREYLRFTMKIE